MVYYRISGRSQIGVGGVLFAGGGVGRTGLLADMQIGAEGVLEADMQVGVEGGLEADMQISYFMWGGQICKLGQRVCLKQIGGRGCA